MNKNLAKRIVGSVIIICILTATLSACIFSPPVNTQETSYDPSVKESSYEELLISVQDFRKHTGISESEYSDADIENFISDYGVTEENIGTLNISRLLEEMKEMVTFNPDNQETFQVDGEIEN